METTEAGTRWNRFLNGLDSSATKETWTPRRRKRGLQNFCSYLFFLISSCLKRSLYRHTLSYLRCRSTLYYNALAISLGYLCFISTELWVGNCILLSVNVSVFSVAELVQSSAKDCDFCNHKMWVAPPETVQLSALLQALIGLTSVEAYNRHIYFLSSCR